MPRGRQKLTTKIKGHVHTRGAVLIRQYCTLGWSDFSLLWNFEKKQVGVVTFGKKTCFQLKIVLINLKTETRWPLKGSHLKKKSIEFPLKKN